MCCTLRPYACIMCIRHGLRHHCAGVHIHVSKDWRLMQRCMTSQPAVLQSAEVVAARPVDCHARGWAQLRLRDCTQCVSLPALELLVFVFVSGSTS